MARRQPASSGRRPGAEHRRILQNFIIDQIRDLLGGTTRHIGPNTSMVLLGVDSLGALQLQQRLAHALRTDIPPGLIWVKPTAAGLTDRLLTQIGLTTDQPTAEQ
jgi:acyl carrier protein